MPWTVQHTADPGIIETTLLGCVSPADLRAAAVAGIDASLLHGCTRHLCDATALTGGYSIFDLFALAGAMRDLGLPTDSHQAVLPPQGDSAERNAAFWETICRNRGLDVRVFESRTAALAWLARTGHAQYVT